MEPNLLVSEGPPPTKLYVALLKARVEFSKAFKNSVNPHLKSNYADLASVLDAVDGPLSKHGVLLMQPVNDTPDGRTVVSTVLIHAESGEKVECSMVAEYAKTGNVMQNKGSAISYCRRYTAEPLLALLRANADDDGENAYPTHRGSEPARDSSPAQKPAEPVKKPAENKTPGGWVYSKIRDDEIKIADAKAWILKNAGPEASFDTLSNDQARDLHEHLKTVVNQVPFDSAPGQLGARRYELTENIKSTVRKIALDAGVRAINDQVKLIQRIYDDIQASDKSERKIVTIDSIEDVDHLEFILGHLNSAHRTSRYRNEQA